MASGFGGPLAGKAGHEEWFGRKRAAGDGTPRNVLFLLRSRETQAPRAGCAALRDRAFYDAIVPSKLAPDVEMPNVHVKRFSDCGRFLLCFSRPYRELLVYKMHSRPAFSVEDDEREAAEARSAEEAEEAARASVRASPRRENPDSLAAGGQRLMPADALRSPTAGDPVVPPPPPRVSAMAGSPARPGPVRRLSEPSAEHRPVVSTPLLTVDEAPERRRRAAAVDTATTAAATPRAGGSALSFSVSVSTAFPQTASGATMSPVGTLGPALRQPPAEEPRAATAAQSRLRNDIPGDLATRALAAAALAPATRPPFQAPPPPRRGAAAGPAAGPTPAGRRASAGDLPDLVPDMSDARPASSNSRTPRFGANARAARAALQAQAQAQAQASAQAQAASTGEPRRTFEDFFELHYRVPIAEGEQMLCRDFIVQMVNDEYIVLAASSRSQTADPDPLPPGTLPEVSSVEDITLFVVRLETGEIVDRYVIEHDFMLSVNNFCVSVCGNRLALLLSRSQTVLVLMLSASGKLVLVRQFGAFCRDDDALVLQQQEGAERVFHERKRRRTDGGSDARGVSTSGGPPPARGHGDGGDGGDGEGEGDGDGEAAAGDGDAASRRGAGMITGLKHCMLVFLFHKMRQRNILLNFFSLFTYFESFVMWKLQFLDERRVLIKFGCLAGLTGRMSEHVLGEALFVVYDMVAARVVAVYDNSDKDLLELYRKYYDFFHAHLNDRPVPTITNGFDAYAREKIDERQARFESMGSMVRRGLMALPVSAQNYCESPYLDASLFSFNSQWITSLYQPRMVPPHALKFMSRATGALRFKIAPPQRTSSSVATYVFHPWLPFFLSVEQWAPRNRAVYNFYYRP